MAEDKDPFADLTDADIVVGNNKDPFSDLTEQDIVKKKGQSEPTSPTGGKVGAFETPSIGSSPFLQKAKQRVEEGAPTVLSVKQRASSPLVEETKTIVEPAGKNYGLRPDGTKKDVGYFGELKTKSGNSVTEYSFGTSDVNGKEMDIPSLVPTLTPQEKQYVLDKAEKDEPIGRDAIGNSIYQKAIDHAKKRLKEGKSPFYSSEEAKKVSTGDEVANLLGVRTAPKTLGELGQTTLPLAKDQKGSAQRVTALYEQKAKKTDDFIQEKKKLNELEAKLNQAKKDSEEYNVIVEDFNKAVESHNKKLAEREILANEIKAAEMGYREKYGEGNRLGYFYNSFLKGIGGMSSGVADAFFNVARNIPGVVAPSMEGEDITEFRKQIEPSIREGLKEKVGVGIVPEKEKKYNDEFWTSAIGGLTASVPAMIAPYGSGLIAQAYDAGLESINSIEEGQKLPETTKTIFASSVGLAQGMLEKYGLDKIFGKQSAAVSKKLAADVIQKALASGEKTITKESFEAALKQSVSGLKDKIVKAGGKIGEAVAVEFSTGAAQEASTIAAERLLNASQGKDVFEPTSWGETTGRILYAGSQEAVGGGLLGAASAPFSKTRNYIAEKVADAKTQEDYQALRKEFTENVSPEQADAANKIIDYYANVNSKIPDNVPNRKEVIEKVVERDDIKEEIARKQQELEQVDEAFRPKIQEEIDALNGRVAELNEEIANPVIAQEVVVEEQPSQPIITKNTTPTDEKYGTIDRGDGKGVIDLTRAEYEAEIAKQQQPTAEEVVVDESPAFETDQTEAAQPIELSTEVETITPQADAKFSLGENKIFFHASGVKRKGRLKSSNAPQFGTGVYFSTNKELVTDEFGENVTEVELTINKPVYTNTKEWNEVQKEAIRLADEEYGKSKGLKLEDGETFFRYDPENISEIDEIPSKYISDAAKNLGYDAIIDKDSKQYENEIVVLDESKIVYPEENVNPALNDVESTAKALEKEFNKGSVWLPSVEMNVGDNPAKKISEAYHADKAAGKETELTKAVEKLLTTNTNQNEQKTKIGERGTLQENDQQVGEGGQVQGVSEENRGISGDESLRQSQDAENGTGGQEENVTEQGGVTAPITEEKIEATATQANIKPKNLRDLYNVNRTLFGQNKVRSLANAVIMDKMIGAMAKRAGVTKAEMYGRLEFRKASEEFVKGLSNKAKVLWQIVGENAKLAQDVRDNLQVARDMEAIGKDAKTIRISTGWERGADGKWRYEIDDIKTINKIAFNNAKKESVSLYELIGNNILFDAYPKLKDVKIKRGKESFYNALDNTLTLSDVFTSLSAKSTLIHEIQHAIQSIEGFSYGTTGAAQMMSARTMYINYLVKKLFKENKEYRDLYNMAEELPYYENETTLEKNKEREIIDEKLEEIFNEYLEKNPIDNDKLIEVAKKLYLSNKGEVEARNVQTRMGMTPEQRRETLLSETEDIARDEQIVFFDSKGIAMQVDAWHGSPYEFDKFTTEKIGTGEGAQAFGWGLYFTDLESIARGYAQNLATLNIKTTTQQISDAVKKFNIKNDLPSNYNYSILADVLVSNNMNIDKAIDFYNKSIQKRTEDYNNPENKYRAGYLLESIKDEQAELKTLIGLKQNNTSIKPPERLLYKVSLHNGKKPSEYNWLEWDKPLDKNSKDYSNLKNAFDVEFGSVKDNFGLPVKFGFQYKKEGGKFQRYNEATTYAQIYDSISELLGGDKQASLFLLENGIDGIKYPAESIARGTTSDTARGFNYVVFDENAVSIEEVIKFQKDANKARGAAMVNMDGTAIIYAITDPNVSTPLHELAHVFEHYLKDYERQTIIRNAKTNGWTTETSEYFARGFEKYLADGVAPSAEMKRIFERFKEWLTEIYNGVTGSEINIPLNDEMRDIYAKMLGEEEIAKTQPNELKTADILPKYKNKSIAERFKKGLDATSVMEGGEIHPEDATQRAAWRSMGQKEFEGLLDGNEIGGEAKKGGYFGDNPSIASSQKGEGKYLVEFGGKKVVGETTTEKVSSKDVTGVWKYENGKWNKLSKEELQLIISKTQPNETKTEQEKPLLEGVRNGGNETQGGQESTELRAETQVQEKVKATIADAVAKFYAIEGKGSQKREAAKAYRQTLEKMPTVKNIFDNIKPIFAQLEREGIITKSKECP